VTLVSVHDRERLEAFSGGGRSSIYTPWAIWMIVLASTVWYALEEEGEIREVALLYLGGEVPTLLALTRGRRRDWLACCRHSSRFCGPLLRALEAGCGAGTRAALPDSSAWGAPEDGAGGSVGAERVGSDPAGAGGSIRVDQLGRESWRDLLRFIGRATRTTTSTLASLDTDLSLGAEAGAWVAASASMWFSPRYRWLPWATCDAPSHGAEVCTASAPVSAGNWPPWRSYRAERSAEMRGQSAATGGWGRRWRRGIGSSRWRTLPQAPAQGGGSRDPTFGWPRAYWPAGGDTEGVAPATTEQGVKAPNPTS